MNSKAVTFDIDSTLADTSERAKAMIDGRDRSEIDWTAYAMACASDIPTDTAALLSILHQCGLWIVLVTARPEAARRVTERWLDKHGIPFHGLRMQPEDYPGSILEYKVEAIKSVSEEFDVVLHVDDWWSIGQVVKTQLGIPTVIVQSYAPEDLRATF